MINVPKLPPFKRMCVSIGNLPTAFMESMTYYEALEWLYKYLADTIIPTVNTTGEAVTELQNAFTTLENYVNNYFENLDVQEEINNKLDAMAESGELTDIIAQYLSLAGILSYNTVSDMKLAENLTNGSIAKTLGYNALNDGGQATYKIRNITNDDVVNEITIISLYDDNLIAELIVDDNTINLLQAGCIGDGTTDNTTILQNAIDICCDNGYVLYIPNKKFKVTNSINIKSSINIKGDSNSSYKNTSCISCDFGDNDRALFTSSTSTPRCTFENVKLERVRTATDGYPTNLYAYGLSGTCFDIDSNESVFNRCVIIGFNVVFNHLQITTCQECDFIYCNSIIKTNYVVSAVNFINCNMYSNGLLFDINYSIQNLNITDCWIESFTSLLKNYYYAIQNFNITSSTITNTTNGANYLVYADKTPVFSRQFINVVNSTLYVKNNICDGAPSSTEFELRLINTTVLYGGSGETINIVGNAKFMNLSSQNITSLNTKGFDFSNNNAYKPITFIPESTLPDKTEGKLYYNNNTNGKRLEYFNNSLYRNIIPPMIINPNADNTKPSSVTPTCLTIAINQLLYNGRSLGWVWHPTTNNWIELPQIGYMEYAGNPTNNIAPAKIGCTLLDTTNHNWYISTGTTNADWKALTS